MALVFPANPQVGNTHVVGTKVYTWNGLRWMPGTTQGMNLSSVGSHVVPTHNELFDLGHSTLKWRDLYLSGNTLNLGGTSIKSSAAGVSFANISNPTQAVPIQVSTIQIGTGNTAVTLSTSANGLVTTSAANTAASLGATGATGPAGATGVAGTPGSPGSAGTIGATGATGPAGAAGSFTGTTASQIYTTNTTSATSTSTGALVVAGGAGIGGSIFSGGSIYAVGDVVTNYSDIRLKKVLGPISNPIEKIKNIETFYYLPNELAKNLGVKESDMQVGVSAQSVEKQIAGVVVDSPVNNEFKTVKYERLVPLLIEAIKDLQAQIDEIKNGIQRQ